MRGWAREQIRVQRIFTENYLQTCGDLKNQKRLAPYIALNSDLAIEVMGPNGEVLVALEYEASGQSTVRYEEKLRSYYHAEEVPAVLYVCDRRATIDRLVICNNAIAQETEQESKLYFCQKDFIQFGLRELRFNSNSGQVFVIR